MTDNLKPLLESLYVRLNRREFVNPDNKNEDMLERLIKVSNLKLTVLS